MNSIDGPGLEPAEKSATDERKVLPWVAPGLDWELVGKIARNELRLFPWADNAGELADVKTAFAGALLERFLVVCRDLSTNYGGELTDAGITAFSRMFGDEPYPGAVDGLSDEFVAGHAIAVMATVDADRNLARIPMFGEVVDKEAENRSLLAYLGNVTPDRMQGVDMTRPIRSRQAITPQAVMDLAENITVIRESEEDGEIIPAADALTFADCEEIAQGLMDAFGGLDIDYTDEEELEDRIVSRAEANIAPEDEEEPHPPYPISAQRARRASGPGLDQETVTPGWEPGR